MADRHRRARLRSPIAPCLRLPRLDPERLDAALARVLGRTPGAIGDRVLCPAVTSSTCSTPSGSASSSVSPGSSLRVLVLHLRLLLLLLPVGWGRRTASCVTQSSRLLPYGYGAWHGRAVGRFSRHVRPRLRSGTTSGSTAQASAPIASGGRRGGLERVMEGSWPLYKPRLEASPHGIVHLDLCPRVWVALIELGGRTPFDRATGRTRASRSRLRSPGCTPVAPQSAPDPSGPERLLAAGIRLEHARLRFVKPRARDPRDPDPRADGVRVSTGSDSAERAAAALPRASPRTGGWSRTSARCPTPPPARDPTLRRPRSGMAANRLARTPPDGRRRRHEGQLRRDGLGAGIDLVFVHGLSGCWQNWLENLPHFARNHRVLAPDLPGFGASPMPPWEVSIEAYGRLLHDFCTAAGVGDCAVIGNSMGGFISAEAATTAPDRFAKLVLVSSAGASHARMRRADRGHRPDARRGRAAPAQGTAAERPPPEAPGRRLLDDPRPTRRASPSCSGSS